MNRKIPPGALSFYLGLGPGRSYDAVARHFGVSKRSVVTRAKQEHWQDRVTDMERRAREKAEQRAGETLDEMNERHLKTAQFLQRKALDALSGIPITEAMDAVRALKIGIEHERLIRGEPSERTAQQIEQVIRLEYERWMRPEAEIEARVAEATVVPAELPEGSQDKAVPVEPDAPGPGLGADEDAA